MHEILERSLSFIRRRECYGIMSRITSVKNLIPSDLSFQMESVGMIKVKQKGFTLIELLIVVLVIGVLSGMTLGVLNSGGIRQKAKDSQRISDIKRIQTALELYFSDRRGYPKSSVWATANSALSTLVGPYIDKIPTDPSGATGANPCAGSGTYYYSYITEDTALTYASQYILTARMEVSSSDDSSTCGTLTNWTGGMSCVVPVDVYCYGVQNQ